MFRSISGKSMSADLLRVSVLWHCMPAGSAGDFARTTCFVQKLYCAKQGEILRVKSLNKKNPQSTLKGIFFVERLF